uniref:Transcriptional regulator n=1 Tax=Marinobacter nauticus TaxID=2743 RepID=A0A455W700_MARNT|nr:hypothetical protein YBY_31150 [Marinobacter nauticus]
MHITRYTDYSLRVLIYLAEQGDRLATIQEIADSYEISKCQPKTEMSPFEPFRNVPFAGSGCVLRGFSEAR